MFEKASRLKLRFETSKGLLSVEDLWDLSLTSLDNIYRVVNKKLKEENEDSLITVRSKSSTELNLQVEILKHIVTTKIQENEVKKDKANRKAELELLKQLKFEKTLDGLKSLSVEELDKRMAELDVE